MEHRAKMEAATTLMATGSAGSSTNSPHVPASSPPVNNHAASGRSGGGDRRKKRKSHDGSNRTGSNNNYTGASPNTRPPAGPSSTPWASAYNPWSVVQAWPLQQWRPLHTDVLGARPGVSPPQAMTAVQAPQDPVDTNIFSSIAPTAPPALFNAIHGAPAQAPYVGGAGNWFFDTGTSSHMVSNPGITDSISSYASSSHIIVGNGVPLPVHCTGHS
jgi:hypothetical protein